MKRVQPEEGENRKNTHPHLYGGGECFKNEARGLSKTD
jgi:hypothetical protein